MSSSGTSRSGTGGRDRDQRQSSSSALSHPDIKLLVSPLFSAMTKITDNLFLTGVGGISRKNIKRNHIDLIINITSDAPAHKNIESIRLPLEDEPDVNISPHLDPIVDRIHEAISRHNSHVLVHCVAGVSRSATLVIAYLIKYHRMSLHAAFNYCYSLRPVIRPNNSFMVQLINYEKKIHGSSSTCMVDVDVDGTLIQVPSFFVDEHPRLVLLEVLRAKNQVPKSPGQNSTRQSQIDKNQT